MDGERENALQGTNPTGQKINGSFLLLSVKVWFNVDCSSAIFVSPVTEFVENFNK